MADPEIGDLRILILDDDTDDRARVRAGLVDLGVADVAVADDPLAALDAMRARAVDVLVTERYLSFVRFLRTNRKRPASRVPILMVSFRSRQADIHEARDAGVDDFLAKPVDTRRLLDRIVAAVDRSQPFVDCEAYVGPDRRRAETSLEGRPQSASADGPDTRLTEAEIAVLLERD
ncbi:MAG: response regulator [Rhodospirillales bacterium]|jgi:DNA-binding response OmpR family regulator|nr:response regulator [Rhodospirillales bacterium]MDP6883324.1 response regulator [Rhodospirillales bacterium]